MKKTRVAFLFDNSNNWLESYFEINKIKKNNKFFLKKFHDPNKILKYDIVFILGYTKKLSNFFLKKNKLNLVIHESNLPNGKGFSPIQWQLLHGKSKIKICLLEAISKIDSGNIILYDYIKFNGTELYNEIRFLQAKATFNIINKFLKIYPDFKSKVQIGKSSFYSRRNREDSRLDFNKSIKENFNKLRIANNKDWPAFFEYRGKKFILKIYNE